MDQEDAMTDFRGEFIRSESIARGKNIINSLSISEGNAVNFTEEENVFNEFNAKFNVARVGASKGRYDVTSESLSQNTLFHQRRQGGKYSTPLNKVSRQFYIHPCHVGLKQMTEL